MGTGATGAGGRCLRNYKLHLGGLTTVIAFIFRCIQMGYIMLFEHIYPSVYIYNHTTLYIYYRYVKYESHRAKLWGGNGHLCYLIRYRVKQFTAPFAR